MTPPVYSSLQYLETPFTHPGFIAADEMKASAPKTEGTLPNYTGYGLNVGNSK
jgi:hypothetical protein